MIEHIGSLNLLCGIFHKGFQIEIVKDPLEKGMATHFSTLAQRMTWTEEPASLQSMGSQRVRYNWVTFTSHYLISSSLNLLCGIFHKEFQIEILNTSWGHEPSQESFMKTTCNTSKFGGIPSFLRSLKYLKVSVPARKWLPLFTW